jgi:hypothetical protein
MSGAFKRDLEKCFSTSPAGRSRITDATCSNYNFKRAKARVVLAMGYIWSFLAMDGNGMANCFGTGTSVGN